MADLSDKGSVFWSVLLVALACCLSTPAQQAKFRIDPGAARYRLVFPTYHDGVIRKGELYYVGAEGDRAQPSVNKSFIEQLNKAGQEGYRLKTLTGAFPMAIVELDEAPYEYAWFQTTGSISAKEGFFGTYSQFSKLGFSLRDHLMVGRDCEDIYLVESIPLETCTSTDFFLLEKEQGITKARDTRLAFTGPALHRDTGPDLTAQIRERLTEGFYPVNALSKFEVLLEKAEDKQELPREQDVLVVTAGWRDDLKKKVEKFAKQGYRLGLVNRGIAIMYRNAGSTPLSYFWLDAREKNFESQLARLEAQGAVYRMVYPTEYGVESNLIFEQSAGHERREYKVLKFDFEFTADAAAGKVHRNLTPASQETVKLMNALVKEGFTVRDLFISDTVSVILERSR